MERLEKDARGALTAILILSIIQKEEKIWGYQIKKELKEITNATSHIKDSSLYTVLRNLEKNYKLLSSEMKERRRYYSLTKLGRQEIAHAFEYWLGLVQTSISAFEKLRIDTQIEMKEVVG